MKILFGVMNMNKIRTLSLISVGLLFQSTGYSDSLFRTTDQAPLQLDGIAANEQELHRCAHAADQYQNGRDRPTVDGTCLSAYLHAASPSAVRRTDDNSLFVFAQGNMLVMEKQVIASRAPATATAIPTTVPAADATVEPISKTEIIAGSGSKLASPRAIALDTKNNELIVLNNENTILVFSSTMGGNLAPIRSFTSKALFGATSLAVDTVKDEIWVANENGALVAFSRLADEHRNKPVNSTSPLHTLAPQSTGVAAGSIITLDQDHEELFALDLHGHQILTLDLNQLRGKGTISPKRTLVGANTGLDAPLAISYSKKHDFIEVLEKNSSGGLSSAGFQRLAQGNAAPVFSK